MATVGTGAQPELAPQTTGNQVVWLYVNWESYKQLDDKREHQPGTRFTFSEGVLQIMSVGFTHERLNRRLAMLVGLLAESGEVDFEPAGETTFRREDLEKGFQPDSCFYFTCLDELRAKEDVNLDVDPPPDLILEIDITSSSLNRLPLFAAVGVPEVWRYEKGAIKIYQLHGGIYDESPVSQWFPTVNAEQLAGWLATSTTMPHFKWVQTIRRELPRA